MQEKQVGSLSLEDPLEKEVATHSSTLAWEIPWRTTVHMSACMLSHFSRVQLLGNFGLQLAKLFCSLDLEARILERHAISFSMGSSQPRNPTCVSCVFLHWQAGSLPLASPGKPKGYSPWGGKESDTTEQLRTVDNQYTTLGNFLHNNRLLTH